jgi:hypothetical protein
MPSGLPRQTCVSSRLSPFGTGLVNLLRKTNFANQITTDMVRSLTLVFAALLTAAIVQAQTTCDLVFFTDDGAKFTLVIDGEVKNETPASRVLATGIRNATPMVIVRFEDSNIPQLRKPGFFELGKEYTTMITTNKKGERVLRPTGEAELGTAAKNEPKPTKPVFVEDPAPVVTTTTPATTTSVTTTGQTTNVGVGADQVVTTVTVVEEDGMGTGTGENVNFNMGVNGLGVNMNINVTDGTGTTGAATTTRTTTRTTTTTTTTGTTTVAPPAPAPTPAPAPVVKEPEVYRMPGYSGRVGCGWPMNTGEFADAKKSIESKSFEDSKMTMLKQIGRDRCFTVDQVKGMMSVFSFEDSKLDWAKFAYDRTYDIDNYYKVNDAFTFESSIDDLNSYIQSR